MFKERNKDSFKTSTNIYMGHDTNYSDMYQIEGEDESCKNALEDESPPKRKKRRKKHYLLRTMVFPIILAGIYLFLTSPIFSISDISVKNNKLVESDILIKDIGIKVGDNMFKWSGRDVRKALKKNSYIQSVHVRRSLPDKYIIIVKERIPTSAIMMNDSYVIMDDDGTVIDVGKEPMSATVISGITIEKYRLGKIPEFDDKLKFEIMIDLINKTNESGLYFKKIDTEEKESNIVRTYVTDTMMCEGKVEDIIKSLEGIKAILYDLHEKGVLRGLIKVDNTGYAVFSPVND